MEAELMIASVAKDSSGDAAAGRWCVAIGIVRSLPPK